MQALTFDDAGESLAERGRDYATSAERNGKRYVRWLDTSKQHERCLILTGYGVSLRVERDGLVLRDGCISGARSDTAFRDRLALWESGSAYERI
jgi:hypothetical protein